MTEALNMYGWWIASSVILGMTIIWKYLYKFHWFNFWYDLPLIGKMRRLTDVSSDSKDPNWTISEKVLCSDYAKFIQLGDYEAFNTRAEYLNKAGDIGVKPMPKWITIFLWVLIIAEGFGFAYSLGTWAAREGSENIHTILMIVVAFVIAVPSAWLSHEAGIRFHRWSSFNRYRREWKETPADKRGEFKTAPITLNNVLNKSWLTNPNLISQVDDDKPICTQYANRRHQRISLIPLWGAVAWAAIVVIGSTTMRITHLETELNQETTGTETSQPANPGNPFATAPKELGDVQNSADLKGKTDGNNTTLIEGSTAFFMLAFLYLATQGVGAALAAKYAFLGAESDIAYEGNFGFETYDGFTSYYEPMLQIAQSRLQTLQERLSSNDDNNTALGLHKTFDDYLKLERQKNIERKGGIKPVLEAETPRSPSISVLTEPSALEQAKGKIASLEDEKEKEDYFNTLPADIKKELAIWIPKHLEESRKKNDEPDYNVLWKKEK
jgi:hypothetical protein